MALSLPIADTLSSFDHYMKFNFFKNVEHCNSDNKFTFFKLILDNNKQIVKSIVATNTKIHDILNYTNSLTKDEDKNKILNGITNDGHGLLKLAQDSQQLIPSIQDLKVKEN